MKGAWSPTVADSNLCDGMIDTLTRSRFDDPKNVVIRDRAISNSKTYLKIVKNAEKRPGFVHLLIFLDLQLVQMKVM